MDLVNFLANLEYIMKTKKLNKGTQEDIGQRIIPNIQ